MLQHEATGRFARFGSFEADLQERKLTKSGYRIRLQEQPFRILALLLERPGQIVTREEIRQRLWSHDTFVEFDDALNTAVRKLRESLNDSADNPKVPGNHSPPGRPLCSRRSKSDCHDFTPVRNEIGLK